MAQKMTRGEVQDLLGKFATEDAKYREALLADPKGIMERQLNTSLGNFNVKAVQDTADTIHIVVPHVAAEGELSDADLEKVAGGFFDGGDVNVDCEARQGGASVIQLSL
ncbi:MAG: hypothetical protein GEV06_14150 [Luteitalea sp.]|nr:hypothetical protein [Luteitalea sp.]